MVGPKTTPFGLCTGSSCMRFCVCMVLEPVVLELALAGLVADRAVDRVVQEQELLDVVTRPLDVLARVGQDLHALDGRHVAGGLELRLLDGPVVARLRVPLEDVEHQRALPGLGQDLHEAHPAVRGSREPRVPAVVRDLDPELSMPHG